MFGKILDPNRTDPHFSKSIKMTSRCRICPADAPITWIRPYEDEYAVCKKCGKDFTGLIIHTLEMVGDSRVRARYIRRDNRIACRVDIIHSIQFYVRGCAYKRMCFSNGLKPRSNRLKPRFRFYGLNGAGMDVVLSVRLFIRKLQLCWRKKKRRNMSRLLIRITPLKDFSFVLNHFSKFLLQ